MDEIMVEHLKELKKSLKKWKEYEKISFKEFSKDVDKQNMIMHGMLRSIQAAIDIGNDIIALKELEEPSTYKEIFSILGNNKIIDKKLSEQLRSLAGFRNALVHLYWKIDLKRSHNILKKRRVVLKKFYGIAKKLGDVESKKGKSR